MSNDNKEYFLAVDKDQLEQTREALAKLYGFVAAESDRQVNPENGMPYSNAGQLFQEVIKPLKTLNDSISATSFHVRDMNKTAQATKDDLIRVVIKAISENTDPMLLPAALMNAIEKFEIIGRDKGKEFGEDEQLPF